MEIPVHKRYIIVLMISVQLGVCFHSSFAQAGASEEQNHVPLLSKLSPMQNTSWVSSNATFALGFSLVANNAYLLSIWFNNISARTIVWSANRDMLVTSASTLELTGDGNLVLTDNSQRAVVWTSGTSNLSVMKAEMKDTGNFVLLDKSSQVVWESFNYPTDTLLPNQTLTQGFSLISSQSPSSVASGDYCFIMHPLEGQLKLYNRQLFPDASISYWKVSHNESEAGPSTWTIRAAGDFGLYGDGVNGSTHILLFITPDYGQLPPRRMTLDADGNLRMYSWDWSSGSWVQMWRAVESECQILGLCGPYGICSVDPLKVRSRCFCPPGFQPVDPQNSLQGCAPTQPLACGNNLTKFATLENTDFPFIYDYRTISRISQLDCEQMCSNDCSCIGLAYYVDGSGMCFLKRGGLINGYTKAELAILFLVKVPSSQTLPPSTSLTSTSPSLLDGFEQNPQPDQCSPMNCTGQGASKPCESSMSCRTTRDISIAAVSPFALSLGLAFILLLYTKKWPRPRGYRKVCGAQMFCHFSYKELQTATSGFSETLGTGEFGTVYKGLLVDVGYVAIKKLDRVHQSEEEFSAEVQTMGKIHHMNLVRLHGYCSEGSHRMLVYEYLSHGSLDNFLYQSPPSEKHLEWSVRLKIALGTARGIAYLHEECKECIIHCNIKPQNILLDDQFTPIVSDFGLAILLQKDKSRTFTTLWGTLGYVAPEWMSNSVITVKADVYSYGMVLLELLARRRNFEPHSSRSNFAKWAIEQMASGKLQDVAAKEASVDSGEESGQLRLQQVERVLKLALWCIQNDPSTRPSMGKVVQVLQGSMEVSDFPISESISSTHVDPSNHQLSSFHDSSGHYIS